MRTIALTAMLAMSGLAASQADAAFILAENLDRTLTKTGGTWANAWLINITPAQAAQVPNFTHLTMTVIAGDTPNWVSDGNVGFGWNVEGFIPI